MLKRSVLIPILILSIAAALFFTLGSRWPAWGANADTQETDDAYVRADQTSLSTRVSGSVRRVNISDYQTVNAGQSLVELDDSDYQARVVEAKAALEAAKAEYDGNQNAKHVAESGVDAAQQGIRQAQAAEAVAQAGVDSVQADVTRSESEYRRQRELLSSKAATQQQFEEAQAAQSRASAGMQGKQAEVSRASFAVGSTRSALAGVIQQRVALNARDAVLRAQIEAKKAAITVAEVDLGYTKIYAPSDGAVGEVRVHPGQLVGAGMQVVDVVQHDVWIQANYRETQLGRVQQGDLADVRIDALQGHIYKGRVAQISPASGSQFALLPPDNATGNYTKVVQRVPLRIVLDQGQGVERLRPGFSAVVSIHVSGSSTGTQ